MSSYIPQPEDSSEGWKREEEGVENGREETVPESQAGKGTLEHQPQRRQEPQQLEPDDRDESSEGRPSAGTETGTAGDVPDSELRLVLLGLTRSGKSTVGNTILGREEFISGGDSEAAVTQECEKRRGAVVGRQVAVVDTPDWFSSQGPLEEVRCQLSACAALSAPGPHAFLLCVPVDQPAEEELRALDPLEEAFGPEAVRGRTLVLFTYADRLGGPEGGAEEGGKEGDREAEKVQGVEEYITTCRVDLLELVARCGDHFHVLVRGGGRAEGGVGVGSSVRELLEKVEQMVQEAGGDHYTSNLFDQAESRVRQRQEEIVRERRRERGEGGVKAEECVEEEEEWARAREEAERSAGDLQLDSIPALWLPPPSTVTAPCFLYSIWETLAAWVARAFKFVRGGALLGGVVRVLVGGPLGGVLGATVGSVVTEVRKRKHVKKQ